MKYIPADKLIAEIERQQRRLILLSNTEQVDMRRDCALQNGVYDNILGIITSLQQEQPESELEKEIEKYCRIYYNCNYPDQIQNGKCSPVMPHIVEAARHFYELGFTAGKEEALKDLPRWKKCDGQHCIPDSLIQRSGLYAFGSSGQTGDKFIPLRDLEKLPKED